MPYRSEEHTSELQSHDNLGGRRIDRKSTRLNSSHTIISYAVFCLKKRTRRISACPPLSRRAGPRRWRFRWRLVGCETARPEAVERSVAAGRGPVGRVLFFLLHRAPPISTFFPHSPLSD